MGRIFSFVVLPIILTITWFTVLKDVTYTDWFHLAKVYSATAGCIGFWFIRHIEKKINLLARLFGGWRIIRLLYVFPH